MTLKHTNQRRYIIARRCIVVVVVLIFALISYLLICRIIQIRESENLCEVYREDAVAAYDHYSGWINSSEITEYMELSDSDVESPSVLHRFKDDVQDVLDYLDDEPIPTCNAGFFEYDLAEWSKSPKYYDNQLESLCSDAVKSEIELINRYGSARKVAHFGSWPSMER